MSSEKRMTGRVALVTGAGSGIGQAVCRRLANEGAHVAMFDRVAIEPDPETDAGQSEALRLVGDVTSVDDMTRAVRSVVQRFGRLDIGVNAAGVAASSLLVDMELDTFRRVVDVCLTGVFISSQAQARQMIVRGRPGVIVNIASTNARLPGEGLSAYCAAKAGVEMLTRVSAMELAHHGIRVAGVGPGLTETPMVSKFLSNPVARAEFLDNIPLNRPAKPEDIAAAVAFLVSDNAGYITGQTLYVDGGALMKRHPTLSGRGTAAAPAKWREAFA